MFFYEPRTTHKVQKIFDMQSRTNTNMNNPEHDIHIIVDFNALNVMSNRAYTASTQLVSVI